MGLRPRSNEASRLFARKPFRRRQGYGGQAGRQVFRLWAALARSSQPTMGIRRRQGGYGGQVLLPRRLAHSQNPSPQHPSQFSDRLLLKWHGPGAQSSRPFTFSPCSELPSGILSSRGPITNINRCFAAFGSIPSNLDGLLPFSFPIPTGLK